MTVVPTFDAATHTYALGTTALPSVTGILRRAGYLNDLLWFGSAAALERGRQVHALTTGVDYGWPDLAEPLPLPPVGLVMPRSLVAVVRTRLCVVCPPALRGYVEAYREVRRLYGPRWTRAEEPLARADLGFAGTPDRIGIFNGQAAVVELKTGDEAKWHGYQLAAYDLLDPYPIVRKRVGVYLRADGTFRIRRFTDPEDRQEFLRALRQEVI